VQMGFLAKKVAKVDAAINNAVNNEVHNVRAQVGLGNNQRVQPKYVQAQPVQAQQYAQPVQYQQPLMVQPVPQPMYGQQVQQAMVNAVVNIAAVAPQYPAARAQGLPPRRVWGVKMRRRPGQHPSETPFVNRNYRCCCKALLFPPVTTCYFLGQLIIFFMWCFACLTCVCWPEAPNAIENAKANKHLIKPGDEEISKQRGRQVAQSSKGCTKLCVNCSRCTSQNCIVPCWILTAWGDEDPDTCEDCEHCCDNCC